MPNNEETKSVCPQCGSNRIQFKREEVGSEKNRKKDRVLHRTVGVCQDCGNTWNVGGTGDRKKRSIWFWILAILFWPFSICIWFYKTERVNLDKKIRLAIIAAFWILIIISGALSSDPETSDLPEDTSATSAAQAVVVDETEITSKKAASEKATSAVTTITQKKKETTTKAAPKIVTSAVTTTTQKQKETTTKSTVPIGKQNALASAKRYLGFMAFSYKGLKEQLEYEGYSSDEATYGVENCGADWNEQAAKKAQSYLDFSSFSRDGLIEQLEYEGFTHEQAVYGVTAVGY
ncbi:MAG: Ltp family lipoprotein [Clostridiales bacterium]|nr:Ltp family lipoprotein [Clostridiales bacterium]